MNNALTKETLDAAIPDAAVSEREAWYNGPKLSYLTGAYVINRLNQVLGHGKWSYTIKAMNKVFEGTIKQKNGDAFTTSYIVQVTFQAIVNGQVTTYEEVGYGDGTDAKSQGKAHELATKEAVTDALKRAAKNLGMSFGLQLYFKEGAYTGCEVSKAENKTADALAVVPPVQQTGVRRDYEVGSKDQQPVQTNKSSARTESSNSKSTHQSPKPTKATLEAAFKVLKEQKKTTPDFFKETFLGGVGLSKLTEEQATAALTKVAQSFPELGI